MCIDQYVYEYKYIEWWCRELVSKKVIGKTWLDVFFDQIFYGICYIIFWLGKNVSKLNSGILLLLMTSQEYDQWRHYCRFRCVLPRKMDDPLLSNLLTLSIYNKEKNYFEKTCDYLFVNFHIRKCIDKLGNV